MAHGGILLPAPLASSMKISIGDWRKRRNMLAEIKWTKIHRKKFDEYSEFARGAMFYISTKQLAFRSLVLRNEDIDYHGFHDGDKEKGHYKFVYRLLFHAHCTLIKPGDTLSVFLDDRQGHYDLVEFKEVLDAALSSKRGFAPRSVRHVAMVDSKQSDFMQMNDVLLGAVGHDNNRRSETAGCRPEKMAMAKMIAELAGLPHLRVNTGPSMTHFGIWRFRLRPKKEKRRSP